MPTRYQELTRTRAQNGAIITCGRQVILNVTEKRGVVSIRTQRMALVRRIFSLDGTDYLHVHFTCRSAASPVRCLVDGSCKSVKARHILRVYEGARPQFVTSRDSVWRDPLPRGFHDPDERSDPFDTTACDSCLTREAERARALWIRNENFSVGCATYHVGDLVFLDAEYSGQAWGVGVLSSIGRNGWMVRLCGRVAGLEGVVYSSEYELYMRDEVVGCDLGKIVGKAPVNFAGSTRSFKIDRRLPGGAREHIDSLVRLQRAPKPCPACYNDTTKRHDEEFEKLRLPAGELYAGGGGSVFGTNKHFDVRFAVDQDEVACRTLRANFGGMKVCHRKVADFHSSSPAPPPGGIALLVAGPPCQGHSGANRFASTDDARNEEVFVTLNEVERLRPDFFVLENVPGIKDAKDQKTNFAHEVVRRLVGMSYQVRVSLLRSRDYGSPQERNRLFFLAARSGIPLPSFPAPTHANPKATRTRLGLDEDTPLWLSLDQGSQNGTAPLPPVTALDALSDMPSWHHPNEVKAPRASHSKVGLGPAQYHSPPTNDYQREARRVGGALLHDHVTLRSTRAELDIILSAPPPGQDQHVPPTKRRLDPSKGVPTLLSSARPGGKATTPIHWSDNRVFSVAERKRIVGLPDSYQLRGDVKEQNRQMGNAIDVAVASALARSIKETFRPFWLEEGRPGSDEFWRRWRQRYPL